MSERKREDGFKWGWFEGGESDGGGGEYKSKSIKGETNLFVEFS